MKQTYLITGGAGFIGSHFVDLLLSKTNDQLTVVNLDNLSYAGTRPYPETNATEYNYHFVKADICDIDAVQEVFTRYRPDKVIHFAAESHVDRSILDPGIFIRTNVMGTQILLESARKFGTELFLQVSTDEVYGSANPANPFTEVSPLNPSSPYSASKAAADLLAQAYYRTFQLPVIITRCTNNYGPRQFPEKLIPLVIANALNGKPIPVYGDGMQMRDWLYVDDHCTAIDKIIQYGKTGEIYNIGSGCQFPNIEVVSTVIKEIKKQPEHDKSCLSHINQGLIAHVEDRKGHDRCYSINMDKIQEEINWKPQSSFQEGIRETVSWYLQHREWLAQVKNEVI
jgi:dTDP-glucose 4,6-dehydratase